MTEMPLEGQQVSSPPSFYPPPLFHQQPRYLSVYRPEKIGIIGFSAGGGHGGRKRGPDEIPYASWPDRLDQLLADLGLLGKPGEPTRAAKDVADFAEKSRHHVERKRLFYGKIRPNGGGGS